MKIPVRRLFPAGLGLGLLAILLFGHERSPADEADAAADQQVVIHLSHFTDDLHRPFMALKVANWLQKSGDAQVTIFLDLEGVRLAERRQHLDIRWGSSSLTLAELYDEFVGAGGRVVLCPHCAEAARIGDMALRRHAEIGTEGRLTALFLEAEKVIDY